MSKETIFQKMAKISSEIGFIEKSQRNSALKFAFRGIDQIRNRISPLLAKHEVVMSCEILDWNEKERAIDKGSYVQYAAICSARAKYTFSCEGGSVSTDVIASSIDYSDKAPIQVMTALQKQAFIQIFSIPTGEEKNDQDATNNEVKIPAKQSVPLMNWVKLTDKQFNIALLKDRNWDQKIRIAEGDKSKYIIVNDKDGFKVACIQLTPAKTAVCNQFIESQKQVA